MASFEQDPIHTMKINHVQELDEKRLERLYGWVDDIPLSRTKKNLARDFSDGGEAHITLCVNAVDFSVHIPPTPSFLSGARH